MTIGSEDELEKLKVAGGVVAAGFGLRWVFMLTAVLLLGTWGLVFLAVPKLREDETVSLASD